MKYRKSLHPKPQAVCTFAVDGEAMLREMLRVLPDDSTIDALVLRYVSNFENVLRIVHVPTFMKQCLEIKAMRHTMNLSRLVHVPEAALPQLLAIMAISSRLSDSNEPGVRRISDPLIAQYLEITRNWLERLKGKLRITLPVIRTEALLLVAKIVKLVPTPQLWKESGSLIRIAMVMGIHWDPENLTSISCFEKEQRRKIWHTIVELDLQLSLATGLSPAIQSSDFHSVALVNVDDDDLVEGMTEYPVSLSRSVWTDALPQIILASSIKERLGIANMLARNLSIEAKAIELVGRAKDLEKALQSNLPQRTKPRHTLFSNLLLDVFVRRFSQALYRTVALSEQGPRFPESRRGTLRDSVAILSHIDALDPAVADLDTIKSRDYLNLFHILCKSDINQAALLLCYEIRSLRSPSQECPDIHDSSTPWTKHSLTRMVENTLNGHLLRLGEFESDLKIILPLSIVLHSIRSDGTPSGQRELMIRGTERVLSACRSAISNVQVASPQPAVLVGNAQLVSTYF